MPNLLVRDVPDQVVQALKRKAVSHKRSLQQELLDILEQAADQPSPRTAAEIADTIRERLANRGIIFTDSAPLIREDRER